MVPVVSTCFVRGSVEGYVIERRNIVKSFLHKEF